MVNFTLANTVDRDRSCCLVPNLLLQLAEMVAAMREADAGQFDP